MKGGARKGSGRKESVPEKKRIQCSFRMLPENIKILKELAKQYKKSIGKTIEILLSKSQFL